MTNWVDLYFDFKNNQTLIYADYLSNIISVDNRNYLNEKRRSEDLYKTVINNMYKYNYTKKYDKYKLFITTDLVDDYKLNYEVRSIIDYFIDKSLAFEIKENLEDVILSGIITKIAFKLTNYTKNDTYNYILDLLSKYHEIPFTQLIDNKRAKTKELAALMRRNMANEKDFVNIYNDKNSFNKYIKINKDNNFYISQYNYYITELETHDQQAIKIVYNKENYSDQFSFMSLDLAQSTLLKLFYNNSNLINILTPVNSEFLNNDRNLRYISPVFKTNMNISYLNLLIKYNDLTKSLSSKLKRFKINYYIYLEDSSQITEFDEDKYYVLSRSFVKKHGNINKDNVFNENINIYMTEKELLQFNSKERK